MIDAAALDRFILGPLHGAVLPDGALLSQAPQLNIFSVTDGALVYVRVLWWVGRADSRWKRDGDRPALVIGGNVYRTVYVHCGSGSEDALEAVFALDAKGSKWLSRD